MSEHEDPTHRDRAAQQSGAAGAPAGTPPEQSAGGDPSFDTIDFFGASASPTLPVPSSASVPSRTQPPASGPAVDDPGSADGRPRSVEPGTTRVSHGVRVRTVVFGLVMLAISVVSLVTVLTKTHIDPGGVLLGLLIGAGAALLIGGLTAAVRDVRRGTRVGT